MGNRIFLQMLPLTFQSCCFKVLGSVSVMSPCSSSIFAALALHHCLCKQGVPRFSLTLPTMVEPEHLKSVNPRKQYEEIFFSSVL